MMKIKLIEELRAFSRQEIECEKVSEEDDLLQILNKQVVEKKSDGKSFALFCREQLAGKGEDCDLAVIGQDTVLMGVFDGCGGSGAKVYPLLGGQTGAWVASRAAAYATRLWHVEHPKHSEGSCLYEYVKGILDRCRECSHSSQTLLGSLSREFPTTMAVFVKDRASTTVDFFWCGDSRCFVMDEDGLHQVTVDDVTVTDAMRNLREDSPMTNVICTSQPFQIHEKKLKVKTPSVLLAATDGCFGYYPSPMAFELNLLETLDQAKNVGEWAKLLESTIGMVSGDDYTMVLSLQGGKSFQKLKRTFHGRLAELKEQYPQENVSEDELFQQWEHYRKSYECLMIQEQMVESENEARNQSGL